MKDIFNFINESKSIIIELPNEDELYNILNAIITEYNRCKYEHQGVYVRQYESLWKKIIASIKKQGIELDADYNKSLSKIHIE